MLGIRRTLPFLVRRTEQCILPQEVSFVKTINYNHCYFLPVYCPIGISLKGNSGCLPRRKPAATKSRYPTYGACWVFSVSLIHRTLTWTTGSLTCAHMLMHAIAHGGVRTPKESLHRKEWSFCVSHLLACQVRVTVSETGLCCCVPCLSNAKISICSLVI